MLNIIRGLCSLVLVIAILPVGCASVGRAAKPDAHPTEFGVMSWNIWRGGREDGPDIGPRRVVEVIRDSGVDLVAMQETYGSGEHIAAELGFHFLPRGTNVSILSRFPIIEDISVFAEFKCVGALVNLPDGRRVAVYSIWLPYAEDIWLPGVRQGRDPSSLITATEPSRADLERILDAIEERLAGETYAGVPVILAGDFNAMSHLDYADIALDQYGVTVSWPTTRQMSERGFRDAYRQMHPAIDRAKDRTWSPRFPEQEQDRIDFIYFKGPGLAVTHAEHIDRHPDTFPSDHAAVVARFHTRAAPSAPSDHTLSAVTYNIRHGRGTDDRVDLARTARVLKDLDPHLIGLQEVDDRARRTGGVNQAAELGRQLGMHAAFGPFMDYQGGRYGMAILSRYPFVDVHVLPLPDGHEPRIALVAHIRLPNDEIVTVVNVHFDWVDDDAFRFAQAQAVAEYLRGLQTPFVLLGDFNDQPGSRTHHLFSELAQEAMKPEGERFTYPSTAPTTDIDSIFTSPRSRWSHGQIHVHDESIASDHRPVSARLILHPDKNGNAPLPHPGPTTE